MLDNSQLNPQQLEAVVHTGAPLLVLAGAGSGKTRVITYKIAELIRTQSVNPRYITAVTFTNRAAREMRERAEQLYPAARDARICTFHSYGAQFLRRYAAQSGLNPHFSIYDDDESVGVLAILYPNEARAALKQIAHKIARAKNLGLLPTSDLTPIDRSPDFAHHYAQYQSHLEEVGNMDFGDLILRPLTLLRKVPEVRRAETQRLKALLIDEYQDTNRAQYELVRALYHDQLYLCAVGDDDQSIYRFRGAEVDHIIDFPTQFSGAVVSRLEQNYRSTSPILSLADAVVNNNRRRHRKRLWTDRQGGALPELSVFESDFDEARYCIERIRHDWREKETAILYRTNAQSRLFENELIRAAIEYKIIGSVRFYAREEIKDVVAFLKVLYNPYDEVSFRRIINKPPRGIGAVAQHTIGEIRTMHSCNVLEALDIYSRGTGKNRKAQEGARRIVQICTEAQSRLQQTNNRIEDAPDAKETIAQLGQLVRFINEESDLQAYHRDQDGESNGPRGRNLEELARATSRFALSYDGLRAFLERIELESGEREERRAGSSDNVVTLMTMHNTKGLEFERVFVVGLQDGLFPRLTEMVTEEIEEERRLLYVAITRAKHYLFLTSFRIRHLYGRAQEDSMTRFLEEVPEDLYNRVDYSSSDTRTRYTGSRGLARASYTVQPRSSEQSAPLGQAGQDARFSLGDNVYNDDYGPGVISERKLENQQVLVTVRFQSGKVAHFIEKYAALDKIAAGET